MSLTAANAFELVCRYVNPAVLTRTLPRIAKYVALLVLVLNARSLPFAWHYRVFLPVFQLRYRFWMLRLSLMFRSRKEKEAVKAKWLEQLSPIGQDPIDRTLVYKTWASLDDCDYNMHLSNSCYPKTLDSARLLAALDFFPSFLRAGGWIALGATHFNFIREIPIFSKYEVRMNMVSWDNKWLFLVVRFVTKPSKKSGGKTAMPLPAPADAPSQDMPFPSLHTPASGTSTPLPPRTSSADALKAFAAQIRGTHEPDGALVNCISVNELVFKHGRITVPPALVLAADGFCAPAPAGAAPYSRESPPPHWEQVAKINVGGVRAMRAFLRGGWRDVPEDERWWEHALAGLEARRAENLKLVFGVREGIDGARAIIG